MKESHWRRLHIFYDVQDIKTTVHRHALLWVTLHPSSLLPIFLLATPKKLSDYQTSLEGNSLFWPVICVVSVLSELVDICLFRKIHAANYVIELGTRVCSSLNTCCCSQQLDSPHLRVPGNPTPRFLTIKHWMKEMRISKCVLTGFKACRKEFMFGPVKFVKSLKLERSEVLSTNSLLLFC